jgi:hypothetical protein
MRRYGSTDPAKPGVASTFTSARTRSNEPKPNVVAATKAIQEAPDAAAMAAFPLDRLRWFNSVAIGVLLSPRAAHRDSCRR